MVLYLAIFFVIIALDQVSKSLITVFFSVGQGTEVIKGILDFTYVRNEGAAFGMLQGARWFFIIITVAAIAAAVFYIVKAKPSSKLERTALAFISGGAIGNFIDRLCLSYVRDFISVQFIDFPVFNIADCFVCIGAGLYILYTLLDAFKPKSKEVKSDE